MFKFDSLPNVLNTVVRFSAFTGIISENVIDTVVEKVGVIYLQFCLKLF